jgi:lysozyme family protein
MANFESALAVILQNEKGYQNVSADKGNYNSRGELVGTNRGISAPTYERYLGHPPTVAEIKAITPAIASIIYRADYWNPNNFSVINSQILATQLMDIAVLQGAGRMARLAQQALNAIGYKVSIDGVFGPESRNAINKATSEGKEVILNNQLATLRESTLNSTDFPGWVARAESFLLDASTAVKKKIRFFSL